MVTRRQASRGVFVTDVHRTGEGCVREDVCLRVSGGGIRMLGNSSHKS